MVKQQEQNQHPGMRPNRRTVLKGAASAAALGSTGALSAFNQAFYVRRGYRVVAEEVRGSVPIVVMERDRS